MLEYYREIQKMARYYVFRFDGGDSIYPPEAVGISQRY